MAGLKHHYRTTEMIEFLVDNPELTAVKYPTEETEMENNYDDNLIYTNGIIVWEKKYLKMKDSLVHDSQEYMFILDKDILASSWTFETRSIGIEKALKAWFDGNSIYCKVNGEKFYLRKGDKYFRKHNISLTAAYFSKEELINGEWFLDVD